MDDRLIAELSELPQIPEASIQAYKDHLAALVDRVNNNMSARADVRLLIGENPLSVMFANHKNHALFMSNVFALHQYELLAQIVPWVYRAYHSQGFSYTYFPAHLQAWRTALQEMLPAERAEPLISVYDWMLSRHEDFMHCSEQARFMAQEPVGAWNAVYTAFTQALVRGERHKIMQLGQDAVRSPQDLVDFYLQVLQPAMYTVGEMWERGEISVAKEHLASALVNRLMSVQYIDFMRTQEKRGKVIVSAAANEFHEIGATMVANSLELDGWEVEYLGANMPQDKLLEFVADQNPDILALSAAMPFNLESVQSVIQSMRSWPAEKRPRIMVGGLAFAGFPKLPEQLGADGYARDCSQAVQLARTWQG